MRLWEVFRFEARHQLGRRSTWLYFAVFLGLAVLLSAEVFVGNARSGGYVFNGPFTIAGITVLGTMIGLLMMAAVAGDAATRDVQAGIEPLFDTTPVGRATRLAGRFLAAFAVVALLLAALPLGLALAATMPGLEPELVGPFRPAAYLGSYAVLALGNAFVAMALLFAMAALGRRAIAGYLGGVLLFLGPLLIREWVAGSLGRWELAKLLDPLAFTVLSELSRSWTAIEKSTLPIPLAGGLLANRLLWLGVAVGVFAVTLLRRRCARGEAPGRRRQAAARRPVAVDGAAAARSAPIAVPAGHRSFDVATRARQALAVALRSFREVATSRGALALAALAALLVMVGPELMEHLGIPLVPTTERVTAIFVFSGDVFQFIAPLFIVFYAGELVWRERETGVADVADATPVPEWVLLTGKLAGLGLAIVALQTLMMAAGMLVQALLGYHHFEAGLYLRILLGLRLADHLLLAALALAVHVLVDQKYVGHLVVLLAYGFTAFAAALGVEHNLLVYGSDPGWAYSDMRGFEPFLAPVLWFKLYWAGWALLLTVAAKLLWVRGRERGLRSRLRAARRRLTRPTAWTAAAAAGLVLAVGGFVFYNTNVLHTHRTAAERAERRAEYERRYGHHEGAPQPRLVGTSLHVEIHPRRRAVDVRGTYRLENRTAAAIDSVHVTTDPEVDTRRLDFDRTASPVLVDEELAFRVYRLEEPLQPGDVLRMRFAVRFAPRGFPNRGIDASVAANGSSFGRNEWLPEVGYRPGRELANAGERRAHGLAPRPAVRPLDDVEARSDVAGVEGIAFEAVVGTDAGQIAVAPGALRRTWTAGGRRYFHYVADAPIRNIFNFFSADYAVHEARWNDVAIKILHHPGHAWNLERMVASVQASLDHYTRRFGPYPHRQIRLVETPGPEYRASAFPGTIAYTEGFAVLDPARDHRGIDYPFAVMAHEIAHQWWAHQVVPADVAGATLLSESLAWYSALGVVEEEHGPGHLLRLLDVMREIFLVPRAAADVPLLQADDFYHGYRKGPFAMYALREYVGEDRVDAALRRLLAEHGRGEPPLPTSLDLYRELQAVTPASLHGLLHDLFAANTFWELATKQAHAEPSGDGGWRVTLDVSARKVTVDVEGVETEVPMDDLVEVGVFSAAEDGEPLSLDRHRVRSGTQRLTVVVPGEPARAGIDPRNLLIDRKPGDNVVEVTLGRLAAGATRPARDAAPADPPRAAAARHGSPPR